MNQLTVGELIQLLSQFPDEMPVGNIGHFGELLAFTKYDVYLAEAHDRGRYEVVVLDIEERGEEPD